MTLRIESNSILGHGTRVWYLNEDGTETEISSALTGLDINIRVRVAEVNTVTLHGLIAGGTLEAEVEDVILNVIPEAKIPDVIRQLQAKL